MRFLLFLVVVVDSGVFLFVHLSTTRQTLFFFIRKVEQRLAYAVVLKLERLHVHQARLSRVNVSLDTGLKAYHKS